MKIPRSTRARLFAGILLFGMLAMTARNAVDLDLWWHLRTGQWIVETGHIPHTDPFSFTRAGSPWVAHEWLAEVVFYELWRHAGAAGLIVFSAVVTTFGFLLLYWRCRTSPHWAAAAVALGALAAAPSWGVRPQMFTFTLAGGLLWLLDRGQDRPRLLLWIPPLFLLWLNLHAGFALGLVLLFAHGTGLVWESVAGESAWTENRPQLLRVTVVLLACLALVPLNPSGTQLYRYPVDVLRSAGMRSLIVEWMPPDFHQTLYFPLFLIWASLFVGFMTRRSRPKGRVLVPLFLTFLAALDAVRHIPIFVLLATPVVAGSFPITASRAGLWPEASRQISPRFRQIFQFSILLLMAGFALVRWNSLVRKQAQVESSQYPSQAVEFLRSHPVPGNLFVYYDWGGYAIWKLYPQYRVFVDGRADLYGDDLLRQFQEASELRVGWDGILDREGVQAVLVPPSALAQGLLLNNGWRAIYRDKRAFLFLSAKAASAAEITAAREKSEKKCTGASGICETTPNQVASTQIFH